MSLWRWLWRKARRAARWMAVAPVWFLSCPLHMACPRVGCPYEALCVMVGYHLWSIQPIRPVRAARPTVHDTHWPHCPICLTRRQEFVRLEVI